MREGLHVAIVGKPNVGKSSVFNALAGASARHRHRIPGTTRDLVTETFDLDGLRATLTDTAGLRSDKRCGRGRRRGALATGVGGGRPDARRARRIAAARARTIGLLPRKHL